MFRLQSIIHMNQVLHVSRLTVFILKRLLCTASAEVADLLMLHRLPSTSSKPDCPCRNSRNVSQAASVDSIDGGSADDPSVRSSSSSSSSASSLHAVDLAAMISSTMLSSDRSSHVRTSSSTET